MNAIVTAQDEGDHTMRSSESQLANVSGSEYLMACTLPCYTGVAAVPSDLAAFDTNTLLAAGAAPPPAGSSGMAR